MKKVLVVLILIAVLGTCLVSFTACGRKTRPDDLIYIRNLYFGKWTDYNDSYTKYIEEKFGVRFTDPAYDVSPASYDFSNWTSQVNGDLQGDLPDVFEADIDSYSFNKTYVRWAKTGIIKALPDEILDENGPWPNLAKMLNSYTDLEYLKYNGKLYGIPVARNIKESDVPFAPFTYIYRRDVAQALGVYKENDEYEWGDFVELLKAFSTYTSENKSESFKTYGAIGDSEWGYPSIMNFFKSASHCFAIENGTVVNNYNNAAYMSGLQTVKELAPYYLSLQLSYSMKQNMVKEEYVSKRHIGVLYENITMANYLAIREKIKGDDKTAIMKVKGPDGKYALEEQEQWFSMSLMNGKISDAKLKSILDIMEWLISPEGTKMALYGIEGQDYKMVNGEVQLLNKRGSLWYTGKSGKYADSASNNGAKYLRYMVTLGNDLVDKDPLIQNDAEKKAAYDILQTWSDEMMTAYRSGDLKILGEDSRIKWMQTDSKQRYASELLSEANMAVINYTLGKKTLEDYNASMNTKQWQAVLKEINEGLNK